MRETSLFTVVVAVLVLVLATPVAAQGSSDDESVLVRVNGDVTVPAGESHGVVVVIDGNLVVEGSATTVVVVSGRADLEAATVETLVVVDGVAELGPGTRVTGDVHLIESDIVRDPDAIVDGSIESGTGDFSRGFWIVGVMFMIGWAIMTVIAALALAAVAPGFARGAGRTITSGLGRTILAGLVLWVVVPVIGVLLFATLLGIPAALVIWFAVLPAVGFIGLLVAGVRLGEYVTGGTEGIGHPYSAAFVGAVILLVVGAIPVVGPIVVAVAGFLGSGAIALHAFRAARSQPQTPDPPPPVPSQPTTDPAATGPSGP